MNALLFERSVWFATGSLILEEEAQQMQDFVYHRPVLAEKVVELLAPKPGSLVVDGTCGGGGHTEALLRTGADVLALEDRKSTRLNSSHTVISYAVFCLKKKKKKNKHTRKQKENTRKRYTDS